MRRNEKYWFTLPALTVIGIIVVFPLTYNIYMGLHSWFVAGGASPRWVGLNNYVKIMKDPRFWNSMRVTFLFSIGALVLETLLGTSLALFLNREFRGKNLVKLLFLFPIASTPVAVSLIWGMMYNYDLGIINIAIQALGFEPQLWLASPKMVIPSLIFADAWQWTPLILLIVLASLESLPTDPFESAKVDGAHIFQVIRYITLPMIQPAIIAAAMIRSIDAIKTFDMIYVMTQGGPDIASENLNLYIFQTGFSYFRMGAASSLAIILFTIVLAVNVLLAITRKSGDLS